jgi:undecaprenyl diphosphate synthase
MKKDTKVPRHVVIIPDGNRRWAKEHLLTAFKGHEKGLGAFEKVARHAAKRNIEHLSLWGMSIDNFTKRSKEEVVWLQKIFQTEFNKLKKSEEIHERQTRIRVFGRWQELFSLSARKAIEGAVLATKDYDKNYLNFFLAYNGTDEMLQAVQAIVDGGSKKITGDVIKKHLYTRDLPSVDLVIRTAGEPHLSAGFMMWDVADAQLYFTDKYWPDFDEKEFDLALGEYEKRERRKGA